MVLLQGAQSVSLIPDKLLQFAQLASAPELKVAFLFMQELKSRFMQVGMKATCPQGRL